MKMYILRWNPNFSMKYEAHLQGMKMLKEQQIGSNWSIYDHEDLEEGDIFIFNQVGCGEEDGIAGFGTFNSEPYADENWKAKDGTNRFYADFDMECMLDRRGGNIFSAAEMEKEFPQIDWHKGHAGVLVPSEIQGDLILYMMKKVMWIKNPSAKISFYPDYGGYNLSGVFARYINGCCPDFKAKIIASKPVSRKYLKSDETIPVDMIEIADDMFSDMELTENSTLDDYVKYFVPVV